MQPTNKVQAEVYVLQALPVVRQAIAQQALRVVRIRQVLLRAVVTALPAGQPIPEVPRPEVVAEAVAEAEVQAETVVAVVNTID